MLVPYLIGKYFAKEYLGLELKEYTIFASIFIMYAAELIAINNADYNKILEHGLYHVFFLTGIFSLCYYLKIHNIIAVTIILIMVIIFIDLESIDLIKMIMMELIVVVYFVGMFLTKNYMYYETYLVFASFATIIISIILLIINLFL